MVVPKKLLLVKHIHGCTQANAQTHKHVQKEPVFAQILSGLPKILAFHFLLMSLPISWQFGKYFHFQWPFCSVHIVLSVEKKIQSSVREIDPMEQPCVEEKTNQTCPERIVIIKVGQEKQTSQEEFALKFFLVFRQS